MKKYLLSGIAVAALSATAAMAQGVPPVSPCPTCNWAGFYLGINLGGSLGNNPTRDPVSLFPAGTFGGTAPGVASPIRNLTFAHSEAGVLGGGQVGVNWQTGNWVLGAELDADGSSQSEKVNDQSFLASSVVVAPATTNLTDEQSMPWLVTARARLGWANNFALWYVTGGLAAGGIDSKYTYQATGASTFASAFGAANFSDTQLGWAFGAGVESSLAWLGLSNNWSAKLEYLYVDLGTVNHSFAVPVTAVGGAAYTVSSSSDIHNHIVRAGLNYRFGDFGNAAAMAMPVASAAPCTSCDWSGFYVGANLGGGIGHSGSQDIVNLVPPTANSANVTNPVSSVQFTHSATGITGGGQVGVNWQTGHWVLGAEADWDASSQHDTLNNQNFIASTLVVAPTVLTYSDQQSIQWVSTARARLGWAQNDFLWYVTPGLAWGRVNSNFNLQAAQLSGGGVLGPAAGMASFSTTKLGWAIGAGGETNLQWLGFNNHWSAKLEYLFVDLGTVSNSFSVPIGTGAYAVSSTSHVHDQLVRAGLNYRF